MGFVKAELAAHSFPSTVMVANGVVPGGVVATLLVDVPADDPLNAVVGDQLQGELAADALAGTGDEDGLIVDGLRGEGEKRPVNRLQDGYMMYSYSYCKTANAACARSV